MIKMILSAALLVMSACGHEAPADPRVQARRVADAFADRFAMREGRVVTIEDAGDNWLVIYHGREGWTGGDNKVWVDKRTMTVADALGTQ